MKSNWKEFVNNYFTYPSVNLSVDLSHIPLSENFLLSILPLWEKAHKEMIALEQGFIANPDENRMVGHYWLRDPERAPEAQISDVIVNTNNAIQEFTNAILTGELQGENGPFKNLLLVGIGGSALGPQLVDKALSNPGLSGLKPYFFDNTDPDGMELTLDSIGRDQLGTTLVVVVSKSGGTKETRNGMLVAENAWNKQGLSFPKHAVAVTSDGSALYQYATGNEWLNTFPMWDWVGGRTSVMSAVGLLPASLQGYDIQSLLKGAQDCDSLTRESDWRKNPAAQLAFAWYKSGKGKGEKAMVVLPYKDRLELFSKYLQQLVMESLGKELDLNGNQVHQGITVYGNKGSTDQHAYVQQLRDGVHNFFVTFIEVLESQSTGIPLEVEENITSGDYLQGFLQGTRTALYENNRESITLTVPVVNAYYLGFLIALYERVVGYYASMIEINAYHQPGVEAGKKAAGIVVEAINKIAGHLKAHSGEVFHVEQLAESVAMQGDEEMIYRIGKHLVSNRPGFYEVEPLSSPALTQFGFRDEN